MASSNPKMSDKTEEERQLEAELQAMTEEKKAIFQKNRPVDEALMTIGEKERQKHERLQQIRTERVERDQRERHAARLEAQKKTAKRKAGSQADLEATQIECDRIKEQLTALSKERVNMIEELNTLRNNNSELNQKFEKSIENLQRVTSFSRTQQKEKREKEDEIEKLTRRMECLEGEISNAEIQRYNQDVLRFEETAELQAELDVLRTENEQLKTDNIKEMIEQMEIRVTQRQNESLTELKENLQSITSLSKTRDKTQQEKIKCLLDEKFAAQQIAVETQLRQLNELESRETLTEEIRQLKETLTTLHRQYQQPTTVEHRQGKYTVSQKTHHLWQAIVSTSID